MPIKCEIVTAEKMVFAEDVDMVNLPGIEGRMAILPNHSPLLTILQFGEIYIKKGADTEYFAVGGGFAEVQPDKVIVLADSAERADEINTARAEEARERARKAMEEGIQDDTEEWAQIEAALRRAQLRVDVSNRRRRAGSPGSAPPQFGQN